MLRSPELVAKGSILDFNYVHCTSEDECDIQFEINGFCNLLPQMPCTTIPQTRDREYTANIHKKRSVKNSEKSME